MGEEDPDIPGAARGGLLRSLAVFWLAVALGLPVSVGVWGCASSASPDSLPADDSASRADLDRAFLRFRQQVQGGMPDSLARGLSRESLRWLEDIRHAAHSEALEYLKARPFHEALCILALRVERRLDPGLDDRVPALVDRLLIRNPPVRKALIKTELGPSRTFGNTGEVGLKETPMVAVFHFAREDGRWKFHVHRSLPLILLGAESLARRRKPTSLEQAVFILEQFGNREVLPEDLRR